MDQVQTLARDWADATKDVGTSTPRPVEQLTLPNIPPPVPPQAPPLTILAPAKGSFAGFTYPQLVAGLLVLAAVVWGMWATSKIFALEDRRVVSVRLAAIVNDFVSAEARSGTQPEQLAARTRAFMTALDGVLKARAAGGQVVLVGEAVVAASVPDVTKDVVADLAKVVKLAVPAKMPPAIRPPGAALLAPSVSPASSPPSSEPQALDPLANPFGGPSQPAQTVPQP